MARAKQKKSDIGIAPLVDRDGCVVRAPGLRGPDLDEPRATSTYFLISPAEFPALHRLRADGTYHFFAGDAAELVQIDETGALTTLTLGPGRGERTRAHVRGEVWQGVRLRPGGEWALVGATMTPSFDPAALELGVRAELARLYPQHRALIANFTRPGSPRRKRRSPRRG